MGSSRGVRFPLPAPRHPPHPAQLGPRSSPHLSSGMKPIRDRTGHLQPPGRAPAGTEGLRADGRKAQPSLGTWASGVSKHTAVGPSRPQGPAAGLGGSAGTPRECPGRLRPVLGEPFREQDVRGPEGDSFVFPLCLNFHCGPPALLVQSSRLEYEHGVRYFPGLSRRLG